MLGYLLVTLFGVTLTLMFLEGVGVRIDDSRVDSFSGLVTLLVLAWYLYHALRHAYGDSVPQALVRSLVLTAAFFPILIGYRFLLFFVTIKTMH